MRPEIKQLVRRLLSFLFFGIIVTIFTLNGVLKLLATKIPNAEISQIVAQIAGYPDYLYGLLPGGSYTLFTLLIHWGVLSVFAFFILLTVTALRHSSPSFFIAGTSGFLAGLFILMELTLLVWLCILIFYILSWLFWLFGVILTFLISWLLWPPILIGLVIIAVVFGAVIFGSEIIAWLKERLHTIPRILLTVAALIGLLALIWHFGTPLWNEYMLPFLTAISEFLKTWLPPILSWILLIIVFILATAALVAVFVFLGYQYLGQYPLARFCGRSTYEVFDACFGIGTLIALILLVCSATPDYHELIKVAWSETFLIGVQVDVIGFVHGIVPQSTLDFLQSLLSKSSIPIFDATTIVIILFLMNCSLLMSLLSGMTTYPLKGLLTLERMPALIKIAGGAAIAFLLNTIDSESN